MNYTSLFIGGEWVKPSTSKIIEVISPSTEAVIGSCPEAVEADIDAAVAAASKALKIGPWASTTPAERAQFLAQLADAIKDRTDDFAKGSAHEIGATYGFSKGQVAMARMTLKHYSRIAASYDFEEARNSKFNSVLVRKEPVGVVAAIVPFNGPLFAGTLKIGPALAAGCTIVFKVPVETPLFGYILAECIEAINLPKGVINIVAANRDASEHLVRHADVDMVSLTGSVTAGQSVARICGEQVKRVALELGGKSPAIVCEDAVLSDVVPGLVMASTLNNGQACALQSRILVPESQYDEYVNALAAGFSKLKVGDPMEKGIYMGPLIHKQHLEKVMGFIASAVKEGASIAAGGKRPEGLEKGYYLEPTLLRDVTNDMRIAQEEIFGPVICVIGYKDEDEAIEIANDSEFGLSGSVWSSNVDHALDIARKMETGGVSINTFTISMDGPFGGYKKSGLGRELGDEGLADYLEFKAINLPVT